MRFFSFVLLFTCTAATAQQGTPQQSFNHYVDFLNTATGGVMSRFEMLTTYHADVARYRVRSFSGLRLPSSGPVETYYYNRSKEAAALKPEDKLILNAEVEKIWKLVSQLDETGKSLETYVRLKDYERDNLQRSDALVAEIASQINAYHTARTECYRKIRQAFRQRYPATAGDAYHETDKIMTDAAVSQEKLITAMPLYLEAETIGAWPEQLLRQSILDDERTLAAFSNTAKKLQYPASSAVGNVADAIRALQAIKSNALDDHNYAASQSADHGNQVYVRLLKQYNQDLVAAQKSFVGYAMVTRPLLYQATLSPVLQLGKMASSKSGTDQTAAFQDKQFAPMKIKKASAPPSAALVKTLNGYIDFVNESLRRMHLLQLQLRNYQSSAEGYRDPVRAGKRSNLVYDHKDFKLPTAEYTLLEASVAIIPPAYRESLAGQAAILMDMLKEMDNLSIELIHYTESKSYLQDQLRRSDEILDRYILLLDLFDEKKERFYKDIRLVHESYPNATPGASWYLAGTALLQTMDNDHDAMFAVRDYLKAKRSALPETEKMQADARQLIADEYKNMKGLQRYGRNNGLCPYSPYEDLGENSLRFAEKSQKVKMPGAGFGAHPYESFYYFYNNELVYEFNKFIELSKANLLKTIRQPDVFLLQKPLSQKTVPTPLNESSATVRQPEVVRTTEKVEERVNQKPLQPEVKTAINQSQAPVQTVRDTVYVERVRVDTVYVDRAASLANVTRSLDGFAPNNMVLLLDVSSSMNSPAKMPLLKRSIKSLLTLLRSEDQISIVLYSGRARVVLKPTSGSRSAEIARMIDLLQSDGDTEGNEGIKLAYKTANKQYLRGGNNRIVLATDGEFPVSQEVMDMIEQNARQDVYLSVFTFGKNQHTGQKLRKLSELGKGSYAHVTDASADLQLILEAQAKRASER